jgi:hypothetical protein
MFNKFKNTGLIVLMISLFAVVDAYGQINCPTCPKGLTAPSSISSPQQGFNGYTSEVDHFDGTTPTCYTPTAATLNGHLRGINNALCAHRTRIDSLIGSDTSLINRIDSIISILDNISADLESNYNTSIISSDSSVNIVASMVGLVQQFNLSVDIDSVKSKLVRDLDYSCLGVPRNFDSIMNKLIEIACLTTDPTVDSCKVWRLYATNSVGSTAGTTTVSATSYSIGAVPADMCLTKIEYIYILYDSTGAVMANGLINGTSTLGAVTSWTIPYGYIQGAREVTITARFWKEKCTSHAYCGTYDSTLTTNVPVFTLSSLIANNDAFTNTSKTAVVYNLGANDVIPYGVFSSLLNIGASKGNAILTGTNLQYTPTSSGIDTFAYVITDIYSQTDTAYIYSTNNITTTSVALNITGQIDMCVQSGTSVRIFNTLSITNDIGSVRLYSMTYTNDTGAVERLYAGLPTFTGLQSIANGADVIIGNLYKFSNLAIADINTDGGTITITIMATNSDGIDKLVDITLEIPVGISTNYACSTLLENMAYTITEYDLP